MALLSSATVWAQWGNNSYQTRRATISGRGGDDGKCTIEVQVDGTAEVEIRGDAGRIRTLGGQPAIWKRFECNRPLPQNPVDFSFSGVDGRGRQDLVRDPRNGGSAIIRIDDPQGGSDGYTFDINWRGGTAWTPGSGWDNGGSWNPGGGSGWNPPYPGPGWGGNGWNNGWGNQLSFQGRGRGQFNRQSGPQWSIRGTSVNIDRIQGAVVVNFDTEQGPVSLTFNGKVQSIRGGTIVAMINSANSSANGPAQATGSMTLKVNGDRRISRIDMSGTVADRQFNLNWQQ
jgi:hypothetical protein